MAVIGSPRMVYGRPLLPVFSPDKGVGFQIWLDGALYERVSDDATGEFVSDDATGEPVYQRVYQ